MSYKLIPLTLAILTAAYFGADDGNMALAQRYKVLKELPALTKGDLAFMKSAAREGMTDQPEGTAIEWVNPDSGNKGKVTLLRRYERKGQNCRQILHQVWEQGRDHAWAVSKICLQPDGSWKIPPD